MVYVLNKDGQPLMPTNRYAKVRILLKNKLAKVVQSKPFTIQLLYDTSDFTQPLTLGVDSGYLNIGFSVVSEKKELICGEVKLLQGVKKRLQEKSNYRKNRRSRLRYRKPKFNNRKRKEGWLAPSIQHKLDAHIRVIEQLRKILPITDISIEVANFDIQKIKNPNIKGKEYQNGEQKDFWNLREYILHRDNHQCQNPNCKNKDKNPVLNVHHIIYRSKGGTDTPRNLITLCSKCHTPENHKKDGFLYQWMLEHHKVKGFKDSAFMSIVRWKLIDYLNLLDIQTSHTYGSFTKSKRIELKLDKTHYNDAYAIALNHTNFTKAPIKNTNPIIYTQIRRNNRSLEKFYDAKYIDSRDCSIKSGSELSCGRTTRNKNKNSENLRVYRKSKKSKGRRAIRKQRYLYQPNDWIIYKNKKLKVQGVSNKGKYIKLRDIKKVVKITLVKPYKFSKGFAII